MQTLSTVLRPRPSRGLSRYSEDEDVNSPYAERMVARLKSWFPGKEQKVRASSYLAKAEAALEYSESRPFGIFVRRTRRNNWNRYLWRHPTLPEKTVVQEPQGP